MVSFGGSTRMYLLQGPPDDEEKESELTVTELKAKRQADLEQREREQELQRLKREEEEIKKMEQGVDWGMGLYYINILIILIIKGNRTGIILV